MEDKLSGDPEAQKLLKEKYAKKNPGATGQYEGMGPGTKPHLRNFCVAADTMDAKLAELVLGTEWGQLKEDDGLAEVGERG